MTPTRRIAGLLSLALLVLGLNATTGPASADPASSATNPAAAGAVSLGAEHACALLITGAVRCWGAGGNGRLGYGNTDTIGDDEAPASAGDVPLGGTATAITAGNYHTCALLSTGGVRCWGPGSNGSLGYGVTDDIGDDETPASAGDVPLGGTATAISAGGFHTCALLTNGAVRCWGAGGNGRLGYGNTVTIGDDETPASAGNVPLGGTATAITAGDYHSCALLTTGAVRCWGYGFDGQLGYADTDDIGNDETPASVGDVPLGGAATAVSAGGFHSCAVLSSGAVRCWGEGAEGQLGHGDTDKIGDDETPASAGDVPLGGTATAITAGRYHNCAVLTNGSARCFGNGGNGRLGYGGIANIGDNETPASAGVLGLPGTITAMGAGSNFSCAGFDDGRLRCWGFGGDGRLGYGNTDTIGDNEAPITAGFVPVGGLVGTMAAIKPRLKVKPKPKRDRTAPYVYKTTVKVKGIPAELCTGRVTLKLKRGAKKLATKQPRIKIRSGTCTAKTKLRVKGKKLKVNRKTKLKLTTALPASAYVIKAKKKATLYAH